MTPTEATTLQIRLVQYKSECEAALKEANRQTMIATELACKIIEIEEVLRNSSEAGKHVP